MRHTLRRPLLLAARLGRRLRGFRSWPARARARSPASRGRSDRHGSRRAAGRGHRRGGRRHRPRSSCAGGCGTTGRGRRSAATGRGRSRHPVGAGAVAAATGRGAAVPVWRLDARAPWPRPPLPVTPRCVTGGGAAPGRARPTGPEDWHSPTGPTRCDGLTMRAFRGGTVFTATACPPPPPPQQRLEPQGSAHDHDRRVRSRKRGRTRVARHTVGADQRCRPSRGPPRRRSASTWGGSRRHHARSG